MLVAGCGYRRDHVHSCNANTGSTQPAAADTLYVFGIHPPHSFWFAPEQAATQNSRKGHGICYRFMTLMELS
jgi:hypothetical protein